MAGIGTRGQHGPSGLVAIYIGQMGVTVTMIFLSVPRHNTYAPLLSEMS